MEKREIILKNGNEYQFINETWETSQAWGHKTILYKRGRAFPISQNKVRYYNRTWEQYRYQTCMLGALRNWENEQEQLYIEKYKMQNGIQRFKRGEKQKVIDEFNNTDLAKEIEEIKNELKY